MNESKNILKRENWGQSEKTSSLFKCAIRSRIHINILSNNRNLTVVNVSVF